VEEKGWSLESGAEKGRGQKGKEKDEKCNSIVKLGLSMSH
jgi:hypothetical protein